MSSFFQLIPVELLITETKASEVCVEGKGRKRNRRAKKTNSEESSSDGQLSRTNSAETTGDESTVVENVITPPLEEQEALELAVVEIEPSLPKIVIVEPSPKTKPDIDIEEQQVELQKSPEKRESVVQPKQEESKQKDENSMLMLMDESIISVPESPPQLSVSRPKDSTFSPIVDTSIHDSRPIIDGLEVQNSSVVEAISLGRVALRTSTPFAQRTSKSDATPVKQSFSVPSKLLVKAVTANFQLPAEDEEIVNMSAIKINPLEKSILKSTRRKRSFSVTDGDSFIQKRVMFNSPKFIEINAIDERLLASFIEEKENAMMKQAATSSVRKRSLSTGTPSKAKERQQTKGKMPNFKAIHEQQFQKMESIADHANRKAERAKKLATPVRETAKRPILHATSKIPTFNARKPLESVASTSENKNQKSRLLKRSFSENSEEPPRKKTQIAELIPLAARPQRQIAVVSGLQRSNSESSSKAVPAFVLKKPTTIEDFKKKFALGLTAHNSSQSSRSKVEERREKNMSLFKSKVVPRSTVDQRAKTSNMLKGVRLNRRFELQMQHRRDVDDQQD